MRLLMIFLSSFLIGCSTIEIPPHENVFYSYSHEFNSCRKFKFLLSDEFVGRIGEAENVPVEECDNITGLKNFSDKHPAWPDFRAWLENVFRIIRDANSNFVPPNIDLQFEPTN